jgi:protein-L-isoaspartate(D-aspartate) O-methyltransferase
MTDTPDMAAIRRNFAKRVMANSRYRNDRVESAFAAVAREDFLGPGPWQIMHGGKYEPTPDADPIHVYDDILIALVPGRGLNNGEPSLHAALLSRADPQPGAHIVHVGAGTGYYSAVMAELAGRVTAIEYDAKLAAQAKSNLRHKPNVEVVHGDGTIVTPTGADLVYVNAGATRPAEVWLDALNEGGRLILPLTAPAAGNFRAGAPRGWSGAIFLIERRDGAFAVFATMQTAIFPCEGGRDAASEATLSAAFANGDWRNVTRLYRHGDLPDADCWLRTPTWSLAYR